MSKKVDRPNPVTMRLMLYNKEANRVRPVQMSTLVHALTCDPADFMISEVAGDPGHMCSQTVTQQVDPFPG